MLLLAPGPSAPGPSAPGPYSPRASLPFRSVTLLTDPSNKVTVPSFRQFFGGSVTKDIFDPSFRQPIDGSFKFQ